MFFEVVDLFGGEFGCGFVFVLGELMVDCFGFVGEFFVGGLVVIGEYLLVLEENKFFDVGLVVKV